MNRFPGNREKRSYELDLKTPIDRSHNRDSVDERVKALVRFLARRAAAEDYRMYQDALASPDKTDGGN